MSNTTRGIYTVDKAHCYRTIVADPSGGGGCLNGCKYCYDQQYSRVRERHIANGALKKFSVGRVRQQLVGNSKVKKLLDRDRVVRIGALGDIRIDDWENYKAYRLLMQLLWAHGYHYQVVTKSAHSIDDSMLDLIAEHDGILSVSMAYYSREAAAKLENVEITSPAQRRGLIVRAIKKGINVTLRLNPMHMDFMPEHVKVLDWFSWNGGRRVILETLRVMESWCGNMPDVDFTSYVTTRNGGCYNNYYTPHRETQDSMFKCMIEAAHVMGINMITICGDMNANDRFGWKADTIDCCQCCSVWPGMMRPTRTWEGDDED